MNARKYERQFTSNTDGKVFWGQFEDGTFAFDARGEIEGEEYRAFWQHEAILAFRVAERYLDRMVPMCLPKRTETAKK